MKKMQQKVLCSNFFENTYFFMNPKAKIAPYSKLSKMPNHFNNGQKLAELSQKTVGGAFNYRTQLIYQY